MANARQWPMEAGRIRFLANAFHQIGRAMFGNKWTGDKAFIEQPRLMAIAQGPNLILLRRWKPRRTGNLVRSARLVGAERNRIIGSGRPTRDRLARARRRRRYCDAGGVLEHRAAFAALLFGAVLSQPFGQRKSAVARVDFRYVGYVERGYRGLHVDTAATKQSAGRPKSAPDRRKNLIGMRESCSPSSCLTNVATSRILTVRTTIGTLWPT